MGPTELQQALEKYQDVGSLIGVYKSAAAGIRTLREIQAQALELAQQAMSEAGAVHHKDDYGTCGWSDPKSQRLDRVKWAQTVERSPVLQQLQAELDRVQARVEQAQQEAGCMELTEPRFYIR